MTRASLDGIRIALRSNEVNSWSPCATNVSLAPGNTPNIISACAGAAGRYVRISRTARGMPLCRVDITAPATQNSLFSRCIYDDYNVPNGTYRAVCNDIRVDSGSCALSAWCSGGPSGSTKVILDLNLCAPFSSISSKWGDLKCDVLSEFEWPWHLSICTEACMHAAGQQHIYAPGQLLCIHC